MELHKIFLTANNALNKTNEQPMHWQKIFDDHTSDNGIKLERCKEYKNKVK